MVVFVGNCLLLFSSLAWWPSGLCLSKVGTLGPLAQLFCLFVCFSCDSLPQGLGSPASQKAPSQMTNSLGGGDFVVMVTISMGDWHQPASWAFRARVQPRMASVAVRSPRLAQLRFPRGLDTGTDTPSRMECGHWWPSGDIALDFWALTTSHTVLGCSLMSLW